MIRRPPRSTRVRSSAASDVYKRQGKRLVITGVLTDGSIAWHAARLAQEQGAEIVLTGFGRAIRLTERSAKRLPDPPPVLELDINEPAHICLLYTSPSPRDRTRSRMP